MDDELENFVFSNNSDDLDDFHYELSAWDVVQDSVAITFTFVGVVANLVIIYMIARNARMRTKTNLILMNLAINDTLFLVSNLHFLSSLLELMGSEDHFSFFDNCLLRYIDVGFQLNETIFVLILVSNTLIKSKRIVLKWLLISVYASIMCNFVIHLGLCTVEIWPVLYLTCFALFMLILGVILFKEANNCYKKWYKKDPLSERTRFRLNIARIYTGSWFLTFFLYIVSDNTLRYLFFALAQHSFMVSLYILIYIVCADKNFKICLLNLLQCKGAGDYDVDATITFAEDSSEDSQDNNHVNINFNANENPVRTQVQDVSTIRVP
ncbi:somatostatin receptor type 5-like [Atheta coriaria]|uniref:somatostatin receptor type 5-like n=1 Tax=Dalotia coriaria TaxID=877792 RepID=UPI0031F43700